MNEGERNDTWRKTIDEEMGDGRKWQTNRKTERDTDKWKRTKGKLRMEWKNQKGGTTDDNELGVTKDA